MTAIFTCPDCAAMVTGDQGVRLHTRWHDSLEDHELEISNWPAVDSSAL